MQFEGCKLLGLLAHMSPFSPEWMALLGLFEGGKTDPDKGLGSKVPRQAILATGGTLRERLGAAEV